MPDRAALRVEVGEQVEHLELVREVEVGRRLVEQQDRRVLRERHRDPGALALAAGQPVERPVAQVGDAGRAPAPTRPARGPRRSSAARAAGAGSGRAARGPRPSAPRAGPATAAGTRAGARPRASAATRSPPRRAARAPRVGFSSRANARSSVDLPLALAPTIAVICPAGQRAVEPVQDLALAVADGQARPRAGSCRPAAPQQDREVGRADQRHDEAGRDLGRGEHGAPDRIGQAEQERAERDRHRQRAAVVAAREQPRGVRGEQADERDRAADRDRRRARARRPRPAAPRGSAPTRRPSARPRSSSSISTSSRRTASSAIGSSTTAGTASSRRSLQLGRVGRARSAT